MNYDFPLPDVRYPTHELGAAHRNGQRIKRALRWIGVFLLAFAVVSCITSCTRPDRTVYSECDGTTLIYTTNQGVAIARNSVDCGGTEL